MESTATLWVYLIFAYIVGAIQTSSQRSWYDGLNPVKIPPVVFFVVWTILYIMIGILWSRSNNTSVVVDSLFPVLVFAIGIWPFIFFGMKSIIGGLLCIVSIILITFFLMKEYIQNVGSEGYWMLILLGWLFVAFYLNYRILSNEHIYMFSCPQDDLHSR